MGISIETQICDRLYKLKNYINSRVSSRVEAEDLYSDTVLKILRIVRRGEFREGNSVDAFMWLCAKSVISTYFKTKNLRNQLLKDNYVYCIRTSERSFGKAYEASEECKAFIEKARKKLSDVYKRVLMLLLFQNMRHDEIADTLGMPRATVSKYIMKMRERLGDVYLNKARTRKA